MGSCRYPRRDRPGVFSPGVCPVALVMAIDKFDGEYAFLSNFWPWVNGIKVADADPIIWDGREWPTVEHAFQAAKTFSNEEQEKIRWQETPGKAKRLGRRVTLRSDWEQQKLGF